MANGKRLELSELVVVQDINDIVGNPSQKAGVVAHVVWVIVAQVLEAGIVSHLARRKEGLRFEVSGHYGEARKGQGCALRPVGNSLGHGEGWDVRSDGEILVGTVAPPCVAGREGDRERACGRVGVDWVLEHARRAVAEGP